MIPPLGRPNTKMELDRRKLGCMRLKPRDTAAVRLAWASKRSCRQSHVVLVVLSFDCTVARLRTDGTTPEHSSRFNVMDAMVPQYPGRAAIFKRCYITRLFTPTCERSSEFGCMVKHVQIEPKCTGCPALP